MTFEQFAEKICNLQSALRNEVNVGEETGAINEFEFEQADEAINRLKNVVENIARRHGFSFPWD